MIALVTGAAGGIGSAIAASLERSGHEALRHDVREGARPLDIIGDLLDAGHIDDLVAFADERGVDCVFLAHGIAAATSLATTTREFFERAMRINTLSMLNAYDALAPLLTERRGVFCAVSSQAGLVGEANNDAYCASKFAVVGWAEELAKSEAGPRIRILCPGPIETPLLEQAFQGMADSAGVTVQDIIDQRVAGIPAGRLGRTADLGAAAAWLCELHSPRVLIAPVTGGEVLH
ncbi:SDR family oxidoreductase [Leucobacter allii]|uniref:SDR family NAD(P)-dependent oxidoreductase n=1 Tax=Leucobacter allii TaxID=2932247 RepID=UPI001FD2474E|nr:SDR family oxidoreductase [Leucobacter allii]UOR01363.1 SDR family oxidoreductase [Leucobacter allii]